MVPRRCRATPDLADTNHTRACQARCRVRCQVRCQARCQVRCQVRCQARCQVRCPVLTWTDTGCRLQVWRVGECQGRVESHQATPATHQAWEVHRDHLEVLEVLEVKV